MYCFNVIHNAALLSPACLISAGNERENTKYLYQFIHHYSIVFHFGLGNTCEGEDYERIWESNVCQLISGEFLNKLSRQLHTETNIDVYTSKHTHNQADKWLTLSVPTTSVTTASSWLSGKGTMIQTLTEECSTQTKPASKRRD